MDFENLVKPLANLIQLFIEFVRGNDEFLRDQSALDEVSVSLLTSYLLSVVLYEVLRRRFTPSQSDQSDNDPQNMNTLLTHMGGSVVFFLSFELSLYLFDLRQMHGMGTLYTTINAALISNSVFYCCSFLLIGLLQAISSVLVPISETSMLRNRLFGSFVFSLFALLAYPQVHGVELQQIWREMLLPLMICLIISIWGILRLWLANNLNVKHLPKP